MRHIFALLALSLCLDAQTINGIPNQTITGIPASSVLGVGASVPGSCTAPALFYNTVNPGNYYGCGSAGTYQIFQTSATGVAAVNGTVRQITANTSAGVVTLSFPTNILFVGTPVFPPSTTGGASLNISSGVAPTSPDGGDFWNLSGVIQYYNGSATKTLATTDVATLSSLSSIGTITVGVWNGTALTSTYLPATTVYTGQINTFGAFLQDFSASTIKIPTAAGFTASAVSMIGFDSTAHVFRAWSNAANNAVATVNGSAPTIGDCVQWGAAFTLVDAGSACGSGSGSGTVTVSGGGSVTSTAVVTGAGTTVIQTPNASATLDTSGNFQTPGSFTSTGSVAGRFNIGQGTLPSLPTTAVQLTSPTSVTSYQVVFPSAAATGILYWSNSSNTVTMAVNTDFTFSSHTLSGGSSAILNLSAAPVTTGLLIPSAAGAAPTADGQLAENTTNHTHVFGSNGSTFVVPGFLAGTAPTSGHATAWGSNYSVTDGGVLASPANVISVTFGATPAFNCASTTAGTVTLFTLSTTLTANITGATSSGCTAGQIVVIKMTQDATGGRTWVAPSGWNAACQPSPIASATTNLTFYITQTGADPIGCNSEAGPAVSAEISAPSGTPAVGKEWGWNDSTGLLPRWSNSAGTIFQASKELTAGNIRKAGGANTPDSAAASADIAALWVGTGCGTSTNALLVSGNCGAAGGSSALSAITAATGSNTIASGNNGLQIWNWALTSNVVAFQIGETTNATGGTLGNQYLLKIVPATGSTAVPLNITSSLNNSQALPTVHITPTWNTTGVVDAALLINVTNTASGAASKLIDAQIGGTSEFNVDKTGLASFATGIQTGTAPSCTTGTAGTMCLGEGTGPTAASAVDQLWGDSTAHTLLAKVNGGGSAMVPLVLGKAQQTAQTGAISTATLCAAGAGACNQNGMYHVHWSFTETGTACSIPGPGGVTFLLTWTDQNGTTHSAVSLPMDDGSAVNAVSGVFHFQTSLAAAWASGDFNVDSNGSILQYATGFTACTTGTGAYTLNAAVTRIQ